MGIQVSGSSTLSQNSKITIHGTPFVLCEKTRHSCSECLMLAFSALVVLVTMLMSWMQMCLCKPFYNNKQAPRYHHSTNTIQVHSVPNYALMRDRRIDNVGYASIVSWLLGPSSEQIHETRPTCGMLVNDDDSRVPAATTAHSYNIT